MIQPFMAPAGLPPRVDSPAVPANAAPESSFAGLLATASGAGSGREGGETKALTGAFQLSPDALFGTTTDESGLDDAAIEAAAERFNEHGFFGQAVPGSERAIAVSPIADAPAASVAPAGAESLVDGDADRVHPEAATPRPGFLVEADAGPATAFHPTHRDATSGVGSRVATSEPVPVPVTGAEGEEPANADVAPSHGRRLLGAVAVRAAQSATRVALSETARGLNVAAFAQALPADEQSRLRDEIAALLSRHGLRPDRIHVVARQLPPALV